MREYAWRPEHWQFLGRLLPDEVRERIFDPAFADLMRTWLTGNDGRRRLPFAVQVVGTYMGCFPIAVPRLFVHDGRLTRLSRVSLLAVGLLATAALFVANFAQSYTSYTP